MKVLAHSYDGKTDSPRTKGKTRIIGVIVASLLFSSALLLPSILRSAQASPGIGYWIIVEGAAFHDKQEFIKYGCMRVYDILRGVGYSLDRIRYLAAATQFTFEEALVWAESRVTTDEPLWIYMFDHGGDNIFGFRGGTSITYTEANTLLYEHIPLDVDINIIIAACHSGSSIPELTNASVRISSCTSDQVSQLCTSTPIPNWEAFSVPFWEKIKEYETVVAAFNYACWHIKNVQEIESQDPQLDDNGDGVPHTGPLPNGGDGYVANGLHIGSHAYLSSMCEDNADAPNTVYASHTEIIYQNEFAIGADNLEFNACITEWWTELVGYRVTIATVPYMNLVCSRVTTKCPMNPYETCAGVNVYAETESGYVLIGTPCEIKVEFWLSNLNEIYLQDLFWSRDLALQKAFPYHGWSVNENTIAIHNADSNDSVKITDFRYNVSNTLMSYLAAASYTPIVGEFSLAPYHSEYFTVNLGGLSNGYIYFNYKMVDLSTDEIAEIWAIHEMPSQSGGSVGGVLSPVDKVAILAPYITFIGILAVILTSVVYVRKRRSQNNRRLRKSFW
ncbi:MAG: hypothetical protein ACFFDE_06930 [Promethearchaeota archaeon]